MNVNILSNEELISYIEAGVITSVTADKVLEIINSYKLIIAAFEEEQQDYDKGYNDAVEEAISKLQYLRYR